MDYQVELQQPKTFNGILIPKYYKVTRPDGSIYYVSYQVYEISSAGTYGIQRATSGSQAVAGRTDQHFCYARTGSRNWNTNGGTIQLNNPYYLVPTCFRLNSSDDRDNQNGCVLTINGVQQGSRHSYRGNFDCLNTTSQILISMTDRKATSVVAIGAYWGDSDGGGADTGMGLGIAIEEDVFQLMYAPR